MPGPGPPPPPPRRGSAHAAPGRSMALFGEGTSSSAATAATAAAGFESLVPSQVPAQAQTQVQQPISASTGANRIKAWTKHLSSSSSTISTSTSTTTTSSTSTWSSPATSVTSSRGINTANRSSSVASSPSHPYSRRQPAPSLPLLSVVPPPGEDGDDGAEGEARRPVMQRVSAFLPSWDKRNSGQRTPGQRNSGQRAGLFGWSSNRSSTNAPHALAKLNTNAANGRVHREAFWPATLDRECDKAARILKSFSTDGYLAPLEDDDQLSTTNDPQTPIRITKKIPRRIIQNAAGIAIFTCMRSGLWMTGSGGSGILIARKSDGTWSPPSGIMLHTPTLSFIIGVDIYDCVLIINNLAALESITKPKVTLGEDVGLISGPLVSLDSDEAHIKWKDLGNTVLTYMKARGQTQTVNLNGCILAERGNENERFYESPLTQMDILAGNVGRHVEETRPLFEVIKLAEGRSDYAAAVIDKIAFEPAPGDAMIATPKSSTPASPRSAFGIPNQDDPDPFGILALEMAGLEIREAGSRLRPASSQFDFNPTPTSPAFSKFNRQSIDTYTSKSNRGSYMSSRTVKSQVTDVATQTDTGNTPETTPSPGQSEDGQERASPVQMPDVTEEVEEVDYTKVDLTPLRHISGSHSPASVTSHSSTTAVEQDRLQVENGPSRDDADKASSNYDIEDDEKSGSRDADDEDESEGDDDDDDDEEPVVFEVAAVQPARAQAVTSRVIHAKGNMVTIPKRIPPPLPMRSPARTSRSSRSEIGDVSNLKSPLRQAFSEEDLRSDDEAQDKSENTHLKPPVEIFETPKATPDGGKSSDSEAEYFMAEEIKPDEVKSHDETKVEDVKTEDLKIDTEGKSKGLEQSSSQSSLTVPQTNGVDYSDSVSRKHSSSIYTRGSEDRYSFDGSSLTTPTSDRPYSVVDEIIDDDTPRKSVREAERPEMQEQEDEVEKLRSKEATPSAITVA